MASTHSKGGPPANVSRVARRSVLLAAEEGRDLLLMQGARCRMTLNREVGAYPKTPVGPKTVVRRSKTSTFAEDAQLRPCFDHPPDLTMQDLVDLRRADKDFQAAAAALASRSRLLDATLSSIPDFVYAFDRRRRFAYANPAMLELFGLTAEGMLGKTSET